MDLDADLVEVVGQLLRHALGERRYQHALVPLHPLADLADKMVYLSGGGLYLNRRVYQDRWDE